MKVSDLMAFGFLTGGGVGFCVPEKRGCVVAGPFEGMGIGERIRAVVSG
jgi:hypothetical protein